MNPLRQKLRALHPAVWPARAGLLFYFAGGLLLGVFLHYVFYRVTLPVSPFIYAAF